jgi:hypothetical protein
VFATDAVIYLWDFNGGQLACLEFAGADDNGVAAWCPVSWLNALPFCGF